MLPKDKFFARLSATLLLLVSGAFAADVYPFWFSAFSEPDPYTDIASLSEDELTALKKPHQDYWEELMKYKIYGENGIDFLGTKIRITDTVGWFGTSKGHFHADKEDWHVVGGPIVIGGNMYLGNGNDTLINGPLRVSGDIIRSLNFAGTNVSNGTQCIAGNIDEKFENAIVDSLYTDDADVSGKTDGKVASYSKCPTYVPNVQDKLTIPSFHYDGTPEHPALTIDQPQGTGISFIDVPKGAGMYDFYIDKIEFGNNGILVVRMPAGGRLTRIFAHNGIEMGSTTRKIRIVYMDPSVEWNEHGGYDGTGGWASIEHTYDPSEMSWSVKNSTPVDNADYTGNLLFYSANKFTYNAAKNTDSIQGTFIMGDTIHIKQQMTLAGQLLGKVVRIDANFDGSGFRYVPFDPPVLKLPTAGDDNRHLVEGRLLDTVKIELDKPSKLKIDFEYCFEFTGLEDDLTSGEASRADISTEGIPLYKSGKCEKTAKGTFEIGDITMKVPITLTAVNEGKEEGTEHFRIWIVNLSGATLEDGSHDGFIDLYIDDPDLPPLKFTKDTLKVIDENPSDSALIDTLLGKHGSKECAGCKYSLSDTSHYSDFIIVTDDGRVLVKDSTKFDYEVIQIIDIQVRVVDTLNGNVFADTTIYIPIGNVNENPILAHQDFDVFEHQDSATVIGTIVWGENDSLPAFRLDVFEAVGGATDLLAVSSSGVISTKKELDYETMDTTLILVVKLKDNTNPALFAIDTMTIHVHNVNEKPTITTDTLYVQDKKVGNVEADDPDKNDTKTFTLVEDKSGCFAVAPDGSVSVSETCKGVNATASEFVITVKVTDSGDSIDTKNIIVRVVPPTIVVTDSTWIHPSTPIYTNKENFRYCWILNDVKDNENCADTTLKPGKNTVCKEINEKDGLKRNVKDCFEVYYSKEAPVVTVVADVDEVKAGNVFTIVEKTDESDTNFYVNKQKNDIRITVKDPSDPSSDTSFTISVDFTKQQVSVPQKSYDDMAKVAKESVIFDESNLTRTPMNGTVVKESYTTKVAGIEVTVSRTTDNKGEPILQPVKNAKGKVENIEVMTVSYVTKIDGKDVTISYLADAKTGSALAIDGDGNLMTTDAKDAKSAGSFKVSYDYIDSKGNKIEMSYYVDKSGNMVKTSAGDKGYALSYTYVNKYGNAATQSIFVVLDQTPPTVQIISPTKGQVIRANFVDVTWEINGKKQDTLTVQGLEKGPNAIVRFYRDKAGNEASDTVMVVMKGSKDIEISVVEPVTVISKTKVEKYYDEHPLEKGQTYAVSIYNNAKGGEQETMIGGNFKAKETGSSDTIPGHLGPTLALDVKLPVLSGVSGLATFDDMVNSNGRIPSIGVTINPDDLDENAKKDYKEFTVDEYVQQFCDEGYDPGSDYSRANLYNTKLTLKIWVYTTLGNFVNYFTFTQELNDPDFTDEAGMLKLFFEMKPNKDGYVVAKNGKQIGTGSYVYKVEAKMKSKAKCATPPLDMKNLEKDMTRRDVRNEREDLLKPFGYKRPSNK